MNFNFPRGVLNLGFSVATGSPLFAPSRSLAVPLFMKFMLRLPYPSFSETPPTQGGLLVKESGKRQDEGNMSPQRTYASKRRTTIRRMESVIQGIYLGNHLAAP